MNLLSNVAPLIVLRGDEPAVRPLQRLLENHDLPTVSLLARRPWLWSKLDEATIARLGGRAPEGTYPKWYPTDISPSYMTKYPCELTPLPSALPKLSPEERRYFDHTFAGRPSCS